MKDQSIKKGHPRDGPVNIAVILRPSQDDQNVNSFRVKTRDGRGQTDALKQTQGLGRAPERKGFKGDCGRTINLPAGPLLKDPHPNRAHVNLSSR